MKFNIIGCLSLLIVANVLFDVLVVAQFGGRIDPGFGRPEPIDPGFGRPPPGRPGFGGPGFGHGRPPYYGGGFYGRPWRPWKRYGYGGWYG